MSIENSKEKPVLDQIHWYNSTTTMTFGKTAS